MELAATALSSASRTDDNIEEQHAVTTPVAVVVTSLRAENNRLRDALLARETAERERGDLKFAGLKELYDRELECNRNERLQQQQATMFMVAGGYNNMSHMASGLMTSAIGREWNAPPMILPAPVREFVHTAGGSNFISSLAPPPFGSPTLEMNKRQARLMKKRESEDIRQERLRRARNGSIKQLCDKSEQEETDSD